MLCNPNYTKVGCMNNNHTIIDPNNEANMVNICKWDTSGAEARMNQGNCKSKCVKDMSSYINTIEYLYNSDIDEYLIKYNDYMKTYNECTKNCT